MAIDPQLDRIPPQNLEAEQSVLGSLFISREAYYAVTDPEVGLCEADFYREAHQVVYRTVAELYRDEHTVDLITVQDALRSAGRLEAIGGADYLMTLIDCVPSSSAAAYYGRIVRDKAVRRQWIDLSYRVMLAARDEDLDVSRLSELMNEGESAISARLQSGTWASYAEIIPRVFSRIEESYESGEPIRGIPSGIARLDDMTMGWQRKELTVVAARPSRGKTAFALQLAEHAAKQGIPVAIFSLEMDKDALGMRAIQGEARIDGYQLRRGQLGEVTWKSLTTASGVLGDLPIYIDDEPTVKHTDIFPRARRAIMEHKVGMFIFDYAQLADGPQNESRTREVGMIVRAMRTTAKRLDVPFIGLSQLSRRCEQENRRPRLSDLRDSGEVEQEVQVCVFIHFPNTDKNPSEAELIVAKNRQLGTGIVPVTWLPQYMRFAPRTSRVEQGE